MNSISSSYGSNLFSCLTSSSIRYLIPCDIFSNSLAKFALPSIEFEPGLQGHRFLVANLDEADRTMRREAKQSGRSHPIAVGQARKADGKAVGHVNK